MFWFATNITSAFLLESIGVNNFGFVIKVLSLMIVHFRVGLDQVCLGDHFLCFDCLLLFAICIFNNDMSYQISQGHLLLLLF